MILRAFLVAAALAWPSTALADRIVSIGGSVTEIIFALGEGDRVVARDTTSSWPAAVTDLPDVGYVRRLSPEGVLSVAPDLILAEAGAGPVETISILQEASIPFLTMPDGYTPEAVVTKITKVAEALGVPDKGAALAAKVQADLIAARDAAQSGSDSPKVLFVLSTTGGRIMAAGRGTSAAAIIELAGGVNALDSIEGYKQVSGEAVISAQPDVILMMDRAGDHATDNADLFSHPAIMTSPAAANERVIRMDGLLLLGFGPRVAEAVHQLALDLHGNEG